MCDGGVEGETNNTTNSDRARRLAYFSAHCTTALLAALHRPIASAVDIHTILLARTPNAAAFKTLMTQVFIHSMEDLWNYEFHPSQQGISAAMERENREEVYDRFKGLTDRCDGLPAARDLPGYWEVPLRAGFPRYVLFGREGRGHIGDDVCGSGGEEGGELPQPWRPAEVGFRDQWLLFGEC